MKEIHVNIQENYRTPNRWAKKGNSSCHIIIKTTNAKNKERLLKAVRESSQHTIIHKGRANKITANSSTGPLKARRTCTDVLQPKKL